MLKFHRASAPVLLRSFALLACAVACVSAWAQETEPPAAFAPIQSAPQIGPTAVQMLTAPSAMPLATGLSAGAPDEKAKSSSLGVEAPRFAPDVEIALSNVFSDVVGPDPYSLEKDLGWLIDLRDRPNGILLSEVPPYLSVLSVDVPTAQEVQVSLPGRALDQAESARSAVISYFRGITKDAMEVRARQHDTLQAWTTYVSGLHSKLSADPWQRWFFAAHAQFHLRPKYAQILEQSGVTDASLLASAQKQVERITPLLTANTTQEVRVAWYGVILQFKQGVSAYREQVRQDDLRALSPIKAYMQQHPTPPQPSGDMPKSKQTQDAATPAAPVIAAGLLKPVESASRPASVVLKDTSSTSGALLATGFGLLVLGYFYLKIRQRIKGKAKPA